MSTLIGGDVFEWDVERVAQWLVEEGLSDCIKSFKANKICGRALLNLSEFDIKSLHISPDSRRKLQRVLHKVKAKKKHNMKRFEGGHVAERRRPGSIGVESGGEVDSASDDGWGSDEFDEEEHSDSDGDIEAQKDEEPAPIVSTGLVAQLRDGLSKRLSLTNQQARDLLPAHPHSYEDGISEDIYDMPPNEDDPEDGTAIYDDPSDDTGTSDIIVQPPSEHKVIRVKPQERGEYIHARGGSRDSYIEQNNRVFNSKPTSCAAPALPSRRIVPPPPAEETYEAPEEAPGVEPDEYEMPGEDFPSPPQDTYEVAGDEISQETYEPMDHAPPPGMETYEVPGEDFSQQQEMYEMPVQEDDAGQETYEIAEPTPVLPPRPPKGGAANKPQPIPGKTFPKENSTAPQQPTGGFPRAGSVKSTVAGRWPPVNTGPRLGGNQAPKPVNSSQGAPFKPAHTAFNRPQLPTKPSVVAPKPLAKPVGPKPVPPKPDTGTNSRNICPAPSAAQRSPKPSEIRTPEKAATPGPEGPPPRPSKGGKVTSPTQKAPCPLPGTPGRNVPGPSPKKREPEPAVPPEQQPSPPGQRRPAQGGPALPSLPPRDHPRKQPELPMRRLPSETDSLNSEESGSGDVLPLIPVDQLSRRLSNKKPLPSTPSVQQRTPSNMIQDAPWFHGPIDRRVAEKCLKSCARDGAFLVRTSSKDAEGYSMSLLYHGEVRHLRIPRIDNQYILGDSGTVKFHNIIELVNFYRQNQVDLKKGGSTKLTVHCPKYD